MKRILLIGTGGTGKKIIDNYFKASEGKETYSNISVALIDAHSRGYEGDLTPDTTIIREYQPLSNLKGTIDRVGRDVNRWWPKRHTNIKPKPWFGEGCGAYRPFGKFFIYYYACPDFISFI